MQLNLLEELGLRRPLREWLFEYFLCLNKQGRWIKSQTTFYIEFELTPFWNITFKWILDFNIFEPTIFK